MPTLWIFDIEPHEQRYTGEWQKYLPRQLDNYIQAQNLVGWKVKVVPTIATSGKLPKGAFLNFAETNLYKSFQVSAFSKKVENGAVQKGDRILFTDAWHPGVIHCKYMSHMLRLNLTIDVMWHAGSYDKNDLLGVRHRPFKIWSYAFEKSVFEAADRNYFATVYHKNLFLREIKPYKKQSAEVVGWPMEYLPRLLKDRHLHKPKNVILFPHRLSPEKQPQILRKLKPYLGRCKVIFAQDTKLSKTEYHDLLSRSLACFSASKQETLGIGTYEAMLCGAVPIVPARLSYNEIYSGLCYSSGWTNDHKKAKKHLQDLADFTNKAIAQNSPLQMHNAALKIGKTYFDGGKLYAELFR